MKLMVTWQVHPDKRQDAFAAFAGLALDDYQAQQGPKIKVLTRWHDVVNGRGVAVLDTNDGAALSGWLMKWHGAVDFQIVPAHDDAEAHELARAQHGGGVG